MVLPVVSLLGSAIIHSTGIARDNPYDTFTSRAPGPLTTPGRQQASTHFVTNPLAWGLGGQCSGLRGWEVVEVPLLLPVASRVLLPLCLLCSSSWVGEGCDEHVHSPNSSSLGARPSLLVRRSKGLEPKGR